MWSFFLSKHLTVLPPFTWRMLFRTSLYCMWSAPINIYVSQFFHCWDKCMRNSATGKGLSRAHSSDGTRPSWQRGYGRTEELMSWLPEAKRAWLYSPAFHFAPLHSTLHPPGCHKSTVREELSSLLNPLWKHPDTFLIQLTAKINHRNHLVLWRYC